MWVKYGILFEMLEMSALVSFFWRNLILFNLFNSEFLFFYHGSILTI